jgi:hypothetical protein
MDAAVSLVHRARARTDDNPERLERQIDRSLGGHGGA